MLKDLEKTLSIQTTRKNELEKDLAYMKEELAETRRRITEAKKEEKAERRKGKPSPYNELRRENRQLRELIAVINWEQVSSYKKLAESLRISESRAREIVQNAYRHLRCYEDKGEFI